MTAPLKARADPEAPPALREGLDALAGVDTDYDVAAGAARFEAALVPPPPPGGGTPKLAWVAAAVVLLGGAAVAVSVSGSRPAPGPSVAQPQPAVATPDPVAQRPAASVVVPHVVPAAAPDEPPVLPEPPPPAPAPASSRPAPPATKRAPPSARPKPAATDAADGDPLMREMKLLNATRKQVAAGKGTQALASVRAARTTLPKRRFDEEWDALEILALAKAGRVAKANRLAKPFLAKHTDGRFNDSIRRALSDGEEK